MLARISEPSSGWNLARGAPGRHQNPSIVQGKRNKAGPYVSPKSTVRGGYWLLRCSQARHRGPCLLRRGGPETRNDAGQGAASTGIGRECAAETGLLPRIRLKTHAFFLPVDSTTARRPLYRTQDWNET